MVLIDYLDDCIRQSLLFSELNAVFRVLRDDGNALHNGQVIVRIDSAVLVLSEILRIFELSDIVIVSCNLAKE